MERNDQLLSCLLSAGGSLLDRILDGLRASDGAMGKRESLFPAKN